MEKRSLTKHQSLEIWKALVFFFGKQPHWVWWNWHRCCLKTPLGCILLTHCWATCWDHTQDFSLDTSHVVKCVQCRTYIAGYIYFLYIYIYRYRYIHTRTHTHTHTWCEGFPTRKAIDPCSKRGPNRQNPVRTVALKSSAFVFGWWLGQWRPREGWNDMLMPCDRHLEGRKIWPCVKKGHFCRANTEIALGLFLKVSFREVSEICWKQKAACFILHPAQFYAAASCR